jgi:hypothetical protein
MRYASSKNRYLRDLCHRKFAQRNVALTGSRLEPFTFQLIAQSTQGFAPIRIAKWKMPVLFMPSRVVQLYQRPRVGFVREIDGERFTARRTWAFNAGLHDPAARVDPVRSPTEAQTGTALQVERLAWLDLTVDRTEMPVGEFCNFRESTKNHIPGCGDFYGMRKRDHACAPFDGTSGNRLASLNN